LITRRLVLALAAASLAAVGVLAAAPQTSPFFPIDQVRPGQVGIGRTVYAGDTVDQFKANIIGVLRNVMGPKRDLILAKLEGGPLATTGVIQGMSGSPVYIEGRLVGAVSYALGSFPREPLAGITPIGEMIDSIDAGGPRTAGSDARLSWPATPAQAYAFLGQLAARAASPFRTTASDLQVTGPAALAELAPALRPIGAAMVVSGFDPTVDEQLRSALGFADATGQAPASRQAPSDGHLPLVPGDPVGVSLIRGDFEMGATGTVTYIDGERVYAFGHPFLNLGPTDFAMTRSHVYTVLPSLDSSLKIASLGPVIGTMSQDRAAAIGGTLGPGPSELKVTIALNSARGGDRHFTFYVLHDETLTPLFSYVAVLNALTSYARQAGVMSINATGSLSFGADGDVALDDSFTGETALTEAATSLTAPISVAATNQFKPVIPEALDLHLQVLERQQSATIERAWLDTTRPTYGSTHTLEVLLRDYRGGTETVGIPVTMPAEAFGPLTLVVSDAPTLTALEQHELEPGRPTNWAGLVAQLNQMRRNNRIYVRLLSSGTGTVVGGETLPDLPSTVQSILDSDPSVSSAPVSHAVVGAWERRFDQVIRGSRRLTITLSSRQ
jgi:SpoIVB peptidase S55